MNHNGYSTIAALALAVFTVTLVLGPIALSIDDNLAFAHKAKKCDNKKYKEKHKDYCKKHKNKNHGNKAKQSISQGQSSRQSSQCVAGGDMNGSCNNLGVQNHANTGNNAAGQDDGNGDGRNNGKHGINQGQSSSQSSQCVAGGSLDSSCNNIYLQNQANTGNNAAGQDDGNGDGRNNGKHGINQGQSSDQDAQCVSGKDAIVSCNNIDFQNQINSGNNALGQR
jgi:hypothetical protein